LYIFKNGFFFSFPLPLISFVRTLPRPPPVTIYCLLILVLEKKKFNCIYTTPAMSQLVLQPPKFLMFTCTPSSSASLPPYFTTYLLSTKIPFPFLGLVSQTLTRLYELIEKYLPCKSLRRYPIIKLQNVSSIITLKYQPLLFSLGEPGPCTLRGVFDVYTILAICTSKLPTAAYHRIPQ